jgi:hypothetical protein
MISEAKSRPTIGFRAISLVELTQKLLSTNYLTKVRWISGRDALTKNVAYVGRGLGELYTKAMEKVDELLFSVVPPF